MQLNRLIELCDILYRGLGRRVHRLVGEVEKQRRGVLPHMLLDVLLGGPA
jgi:hypothetical protein